MMFDDADEVTVFEPNPWGARQRVLPRSTFVAAERESSAAAIVDLFTMPEVPAAPVQIQFPPAPRTGFSRLLIPLVAAVISLGVAYVMKPHSTEPVAARTHETTAPITNAALAAAEPIAAIDPAPALAPVAVIEPVAFIEPIEAPVIAPTRPAKATKSRRVAKRSPIKIDAADLASPLGRMRPRKW